MHYSPKHYTYPPELHFITFALEDLDREHIDKSLKEKITEKMINQFIEDIIDANKIQKRYVYYKNIADSKSKQKNDDYKKELERYYKKFIKDIDFGGAIALDYNSYTYKNLAAFNNKNFKYDTTLKKNAVKFFKNRVKDS